ncbi:hypothetical protein ACLK1T_06505 [Escherichia coli]
MGLPGYFLIVMNYPVVEDNGVPVGQAVARCGFTGGLPAENHGL